MLVLLDQGYLSYSSANQGSSAGLALALVQSLSKAVTSSTLESLSPWHRCTPSYCGAAWYHSEAMFFLNKNFNLGQNHNFYNSLGISGILFFKPRLSQTNWAIYYLYSDLLAALMFCRLWQQKIACVSCSLFTLLTHSLCRESWC